MEEKDKLFQQLLEQIRKHFAAKTTEEKRNKPPTQAQKRKIMCTYLKNMEGNKLKELKNKSFDSIHKMFDRAFKKVNTFVDFIIELLGGSSKRAGEVLTQESAKKQKVEDDKETTYLKQLIKVILNEEEVAIDAVPLATKPLTFVDWKIHKEGKKSYYQIIRADRKSQMYLVFSHMLKSFNRKILEDLYKLVKAKYKSTRPVEDLDLVLWSDLKTMFEPHIEDKVWKLQQRMIYMLVEKRYPLTPPTITDMLNKKLQGRIAGIKSHLNVVGVTTAQVEVSAAQELQRKILSCDDVSKLEDASKTMVDLLTINQNNNQSSLLLPLSYSNIKLSNSKKEELYMGHGDRAVHLEYIDNDVWKVIQNGNSKKRISTGKDGVIRVLPPVSAAEIHAVEKERKARTILLMAIPKEHLRRFHGMDDAKEI
ncbi:hypothetical protein Tco_1440591 [Tanacetum coccineum]